jgi:DNA repair protein RadD
MTTLRPHQSRALPEIEAAHREVKRICAVMPTGAGKSVLARVWAARRLSDTGPGLVLAHRKELLKQIRDHLAKEGIDAGIVSPEFPSEPWKKVQCASLDTLVARGEVPEAKWVIWDECHHSAAETWLPVLQAQPDALVLGLTATPQRSDGKPLGDIYERMVVGAQYSELLKAGLLIPCRIRRPERYLGSDFATDPVDALLEHARGRRGFVFCRTVTDAKNMAESLRRHGLTAACVEGKMSDKVRDAAMSGFASGSIDWLTNVHVLTEGVDVPNAEVCVLARSPQHAGTYLQMVGRVLRPAEGFARPGEEALLIDLPGCSHEHGIPTADRDYALSGRSIQTKGEPLSVCLKCGYTQRAAERICGECGFEKPKRAVWQGPKIWNLELLEYYENAGELTDAPNALKKAEWERLLGVCEQKKFGVGFAVSEYERVFQARPSDSWVKELPEDIRVKELHRLLSIQMSRGFKVGWISQAYKATFGAFPSRELRGRAGVPLPSEDAMFHRGAR